MKYDMDDKSHHVERLDIHLPDQQNVYYKPGENIRRVLGNATNRDTKLTAWFKINKDPVFGLEAKKYYYYEFPEKYTWLSGQRKWKPREGIQICYFKIAISGGKPTIGRMYTVSLKQEELAMLRLLLLNIKGAESWEDLLRDPHDPYLIHETFKKAALAHGLLEDDDEWEKYFLEMSSFQMPKQLRSLFVTILYYCTPMNAKTLWTSFKQEMSKDFLCVCNGNEKMAKQMAKVDLERQLRELDTTLMNFGIR